MGVDDPTRRASLLVALLTGQAVASLGALAVTALVGLDTLLFLAPVAWGLGFLISKDVSLALGALFYLAGTATFFLAARELRSGGDRSTRWVFLAALAGLTQLPAGVVLGLHGVRCARRPDFLASVRDAPVLSGRSLQRLVVGWTLASAAGIAAGALGVAVLFAVPPLGLAVVFAATVPQAVLLQVLDRRIQADRDALLPPMPALPEWTQES